MQDGVLKTFYLSNTLGILVPKLPLCCLEKKRILLLYWSRYLDAYSCRWLVKSK